MILKRTYMIYFAATMTMFCLADFRIIHLRHLMLLESQMEETQGKNLDTDIYYWDYVRHLDPNNLQALHNLAIYFLLAKDNPLAISSIKKALCISPANYIDRPALLKSYKILTGENEINCRRPIEDLRSYLRGRTKT